jgi:hypothetical protein
MVSTPAPCIVCGVPLENWSPRGNQPIGGLAFSTIGHYPSSALDGRATNESNYCEPCLRRAADAGRVLEARDPERRGDRPVYVLWTYPER